MKCMYAKMIIVILIIFNSIGLYAEGFEAGTLIKTAKGYIRIEDVHIGDVIICLDNDKNLTESRVTYFCRKSFRSCVYMLIEDKQITVASDQQFYDLKNDSWVFASHLKNCDILTAHGSVICSHVELIDNPIDVYCIGIAEHHNFFVTSADICVHNFLPVAIAGISFAFGAGSIEFAGITCGVAALGTFLGYQWHKKGKQSAMVIKPTSCNMIPENPDDEKKRKRNQARENHKPLDNKEARQLAQELGYREVKSHPCGNTHNKPVFTNGKVYISPDRTGHKGGIWKVFNSAGRRTATANIDLTEFIGV